jgi:peptidoglycan hydrolase CwlO-like protein
MIRKLVVLVLIMVVLAGATPTGYVFAAPLLDDPNPDNGKDAYPRIEKAFQRVNARYAKQGAFIDKAEKFISKAETLIGKATERGLDVSAVQAALDVFADSLPAVQMAHDRAGVIISAHNGFDGNGRAIDINLAAQTVRDAATALQEARRAHLGKGKALAEAIRAFIKANRARRTSDGPLPLVPVEQ